MRAGSKRDGIYLTGPDDQSRLTTSQLFVPTKKQSHLHRSLVSYGLLSMQKSPHQTSEQTRRQQRDSSDTPGYEKSFVMKRRVNFYFLSFQVLVHYHKWRL